MVIYEFKPISLESFIIKNIGSMYDKRYIKEEISRNCESENLGIRGMILRKRVKSQEKAEMPASQKTKQ